MSQGDRFSALAQLLFQSAGKNRCTVNISFEVLFHKAVGPLKGQIENAVMKLNQKNWGTWVEFVNKYCAERKGDFKNYDQQPYTAISKAPLP